MAKIVATILDRVRVILSTISDDDLRRAILETKELDDCGVLPPGVVRELRASLVAAGLSENDAVKVVDTKIHRLAAHKWAGA